MTNLAKTNITKFPEVVSAFGRGIDVLLEPQTRPGFMSLSLDYPFFQNNIFQNPIFQNPIPHKNELHHYLDDYFNSKDLAGYLIWSQEIFPSFTIWFSDWLLHYNLQAFAGMEKTTALTVSREVGDYVEKKCLELKTPFFSEKVSLLRWRGDQEKSSCSETVTKVREYIGENKDFWQQCQELTLIATRNKLQKIRREKGEEQYHHSLSLARQYAVDDLGVMFYFYKAGYVGVSKYEPPAPIKRFLREELPLLEFNLGLSPREIGHLQVSLLSNKAQDQWYDDRYERLEVR